MLTSCHTDAIELEEIPQKETPSLSSIVDGRLYFRDQESFDHTYSHLRQNKHLLASFSKEYPTFISSYDAYRSISEQEQAVISERGSIEGYWDRVVLLPTDNDELEAEPIIDHSILSRIANEHGIFQIDDKIFKYTYEFYVIFEDLSDEEIKSIENMNPNLLARFTAERGQKIDINRTPIQTSRLKNINCTTTYNPNGNRRFAGEIWRSTDGSAIRFNFRTKHQRRQFQIWWRRDAPKVSVVASGTATFDGVPETVNINENAVNKDEAIDEVECNPCTTSNGVFDSDNGGTGEDSSDHECNISNATL